MNLKHNIVNHSTMKTSSKLTSKESFAILHKIENEKYPTDGSIKLSDWCDQMQKARLEASVLIITLESTRFYPNLKAMQKYSLKEETDIG